MNAFGLCLALFLYFLLVGSAVVRALHASRSRLQDLLIAPAVGFGVTLLPVFTLNRAGVPVIAFARWLAPLLAVLAVVAHVLMSRRDRRGGELPAAAADEPSPLGTGALDANAAAPPLAGWRATLLAYLPFLAVVVAGVYLTGRPMLRYGFDWLSFCNDDMTNYCLAAERFVRHGFYAPPDVDALLSGRDWTQAYWQLHVPSMVRPGSELAIAWVCATTGLATHQVFMPLIVSFLLLLVSAAAGLVHRTDADRVPALLTALLVATSAQLTFGTLYQLIAQQVGLALLCTNLALLCRPFAGLSAGRLARHGGLVGLVLSTQLIAYPEVNPFLFAGFVVYQAVAVFRRREPVKPLAGVLAVGGVVTLLLLNTYTYDALAFMVNQREQGARGGNVTTTLFPFFLVPSGFANFWGFAGLTSTWPEPRFSIMILGGAVLLVLAAAAAARAAWRGEPVACAALVLLGLGAVLFAMRAGFGLYKLAMFAQPFVLGTMAVAWVRLTERWRLRWAAPAVLLVALPGLETQARYVQYSQDRGSTFNEVPGATRTAIVREFRREVLAPAVASRPASAGPPKLMCDAFNVALSKLLLPYTIGIPTSAPASPVSMKILLPDKLPSNVRPAVRAEAMELARRMGEAVTRADFEFVPEAPDTKRVDVFYVSAGGRRFAAPSDDPDTLLVATTPRTNLLNRRHLSRDQGNFVVVPMRDVRNHLLFTTSTKTLPYFDTIDPRYIALYQLESDPAFFTRDTMAGVGPLMLFEVLNPDERVRLCLDLTCTLKGDGENRLPRAHVVGEARAPFGFVGRGAGRVFSPPVRPKRINGRYYVGIDMGEMGKPFPTLRPMLSGMFGTDVSLDRRLLVGFARDISVLGEREYAAVRAPAEMVRSAQVADSPLRNPDLEYAGLYEDGWMAEQGFLALGQQPGQTRLVVRGSVPNIDDPAFSTVLTLKVDGQPVPFTGTTGGIPLENGSRKLICGDFAVAADVPMTRSTGTTGGRRRVELEWSAVQQLSGLDTRLAAGQLTTVGFENAQPAVAGK